MTDSFVETADYVIIGAGAAGCVVASRLAQDGTKRVLLLEAGEPDRCPILHVPLLSLLIMGQDRYNWNFRSEPVPGLDGRRVQLLAGKVVGGSSSINGLIYTRGDPSEYDRWRDMGCTGWGFNDVLPFFRKAEHSTRGADEWHGDAGPWPIRHGASHLPVYDAFLRAAAADGIPVLDDLNRGDGPGIGYYDINVSRRGRRMSSAAAYLPSARLPNLRVMTQFVVTRLVVRGGRAIGVEGVHGKRPMSLGAAREVIVSAGAINSPKLLMQSGIGDGELLKAFGIPLIAHSPQVGRNLQNHVSYTLQYTTGQPVTAYRYLKPGSLALAAGQFFLMGRGPFAETPFGVGGSFRTDPSLPLADMHVTLFSALMTGAEIPHRLLAAVGMPAPLPRRHGFGVTISQGVPFSRGSVSLASADPLAAPVIQPGYLSDPRDMKAVMKGVSKIRSVMGQEPIANLVEQELFPGSNIRGASLERSIRASAGTFYHQCGTCAMAGPGRSVVDARLRVRGVAGLRVADASVMPLLLNATPHATTIMIGEKAADMIASDNIGR